MKIEKLNIRNYRTITELDVEFPSFYTAISGKNNSGKTNLIRIVRSLFKYEQEDYPFAFEDRAPSIKDDLPKWLAKNPSVKEISLQAEITVFSDSDAGLYKFLADYVSLPGAADTAIVSIKKVFSSEFSEGAISVQVNGKDIFDPIKAQEIHQ